MVHVDAHMHTCMCTQSRYCIPKKQFSSTQPSLLCTCVSFYSSPWLFNSKLFMNSLVTNTLWWAEQQLTAIKHSIAVALKPVNEWNISVITDSNNGQGFDSTVTAAVIGIVIPVGKLIWFKYWRRSFWNISVIKLLWLSRLGGGRE